MTERLLRHPDVEAKTGLKRSAIYHVIGEGTFPKPVKLSAGAVAWLDSEIDVWIAARIADRNKSVAA